MAEENSNNLKMLITIALLMIVIAAGTSYAFMTFFAGSSDGQNTVEADQKKDIGPTYSLGDFVVNLSDSGGYQYIKASIVVEVNKDGVITELDERSPQIRDTIITILRRQKLADIEEPGAEVIKNQIASALNRVLVKGDITAVWFTQLVVQ